MGSVLEHGTDCGIDLGARGRRGSDSGMTILPSHIPLKDALTKESEQQGRALRVPEANIENEELLMSILIVTGIEGARNCAAVVGAQLGMEVEVADGRKAALTALRRSEFAAVVVDETMAECDPAAAEGDVQHGGRGQRRPRRQKRRPIDRDPVGPPFGHDAQSRARQYQIEKVPHRDDG